MDVIYDEFKDREGEVVNGLVQRFERGNVVVNLGGTEALLPPAEQIPTESYRRGDRIRAYIVEVRKTQRDTQIILSRTHPEFLKRLFEIEVPEIAEGIVQIMGVAREPGSRSKIAVSSSDMDVDPVGACVGMRGSRVQTIVQELRGEKIDIVPWSPDPAKFVYNALAPAECTQVTVDEVNEVLEVIVPDDQLSLAIGRQGQNVRLAAKLMGWKIDVKSETRYKNSQDPNYQAMVEYLEMSENIADHLFKKGIRTIGQLAEADPEELRKDAVPFVEAARLFLEEHGDEYAQIDVAGPADEETGEAEPAMEEAEAEEVQSGEAEPGQEDTAATEEETEGPSGEAPEEVSEAEAQDSESQERLSEAGTG
jgi:N utilization substance protein A